MRKRTGSDDCINPIVQRLEDACGSQRDRLIIKLLYETGITVFELCSIKVSHIHDSYLEVPKENTKNRIGRKIRISSSLSEELKGFAKEGYLFSGRQSSRLTTRRVEQILKGLSEKAHSSLTAREIRRAYISKAVKEADSAEELRDTLGMSSIRKKNLISKGRIDAAGRSVRPGRDQLLFSVIKETACTPAELVSINKRDILDRSLRFEGRSRLPSRYAPISSKLHDLLRSAAEGLAPEDHIFTTRQNTVLSTRRVEQILARYGVTPNILRNYATSVILDTYPREEALEILGIKDVRLYSHGEISQHVRQDR